ncbi:MAG: hypothetical protein LBH68_00105 [Bifidobacteriaceae bacterium]|jgi:hypothetical protein|nr:hypothetical protein [Bifidobacteriaceae bacterium]
MTMDQLAAEAANPTTAPDRLKQIAAERPDLWGAVRVHPNAYPGLVGWIDAQSGPIPAQQFRQETAAPAQANAPAVVAAAEPIPVSAPVAPAEQAQVSEPAPASAPINSAEQATAAWGEAEASPLPDGPAPSAPGGYQTGEAPSLPVTPAPVTPGAGPSVPQGMGVPGTAPGEAPLEEPPEPAAPKPKRIKWFAIGVGIGLAVGAVAAGVLILLVLPGLFGSIL